MKQFIKNNKAFLIWGFLVSVLAYGLNVIYIENFVKCPQEAPETAQEAYSASIFRFFKVEACFSQDGTTDNICYPQLIGPFNHKPEKERLAKYLHAPDGYEFNPDLPHWINEVDVPAEQEAPEEAETE